VRNFNPRFLGPLLIFLSYALTELQKDVEKQLIDLPETEKDAARTKFAIFVVHNKVLQRLYHPMAPLIEPLYS
jgi:hypothetical protein